MISSIRNRFAGPNANLSDLHLAAICLAFVVVTLVFVILLLRFMYSRAKQMFSYRDGANVFLAKSDSVSCPFHLLNRIYVSAANLDLSSSLPFFCSLHFHKVTYSWRST
ncbi:hypothetical protein P5673_028943, partial [Acropora cervicornis]